MTAMLWALGALTGDELWACRPRDEVVAGLIEHISLGDISLEPNPMASRFALAIAVLVDLQETRPGVRVVVRPVDDPGWVGPAGAIVPDAGSNGRLLAGLVATGLLPGGHLDSSG